MTNQTPASDKVREAYSNKPLKIRLLIAGGVFLAIFLLFIYAIGMLFTLFNDNDPLLTGLSMFPYNVISALIAGVAVYIIFYMGRPRTYTNKVIETPDDKGLATMQNAIHGSSRNLTEDEIREKMFVGDIADTTASLFGQLDSSEKGEEIVAIKEVITNENRLDVGSSGRGKSVSEAIPNILQAMRRKESLIISDPKMEIFANTYKIALNQGYKKENIFVYNPIDPRLSDFWNIVQEVNDIETERLDAGRLDEFANVYLSNASDGSPADFWGGAEVHYFKAIIGITSWRRESQILADLQMLWERVSNGITVPDDVKDEIENNQMVSFKWLKETIRQVGVFAGYELDDINERIKLIEDKAPPFTIDEVYYVLNELSETISGTFVDTMPKDHPGRIAYVDFMKAKDSVRESAEIGVKTKMTLMTDSNLRAILSNNGIDLHKINDEPMIIYVIVDSKDQTKRPVISLFFTFLIKDAMYEFDLVGGEGKRRVYITMDEFYSIGRIDNLPTSLSVARSYRLIFHILIQGYNMLEEIYGFNAKENIESNISTVVFLGSGKDDSTPKKISALSGMRTVLSESHQTSNIPHAIIGGEPDVINVSSTGRPLYMEDELRNWPQYRVLLFYENYLPVELKSFPWWDHPLAINAEKTSLRKEIVPLQIRQRNPNFSRGSYYKEYRSDPDEMEMIIKSMFPVNADKPPYKITLNYGFESYEVSKPHEENELDNLTGDDLELIPLDQEDTQELPVISDESIEDAPEITINDSNKQPEQPVPVELLNTAEKPKTKKKSRFNA